MKLKERFTTPTSDYRTAPLWVWNDDMSEQVIDIQLQELKNHGFGGAFVHPRPGLVTEYLSDDWFSKWSHALETAKKLDMKLYIYDENSYPSGFAGGHVPAQLPDCLATSVTYRIERISTFQENQGSAPKWVANSNFLKVYVCAVANDGNDLIRIDHEVTDIPKEQWHEYGDWIMSFEIVPAQTMSWMGGFAYVDMMRPEVTQAFLKTTYEAYYERFGADFGRNIPAIFTDEPAVSGSVIYRVQKTQLPFSHWFAAEFEKRRGYHLLDHLPALFKNVECDWFVKEAVKVRYDYYCTIRELWVENSIRPIAKWCEDHGVAWTGHFLENFWPLVGGMMVSPAIMSAYEYFQWPALDLLLTSTLRKSATDLLLVTLLEVKSVSTQLGKERILCESYGAGGWDATLEDFKRIGDWLFVHGINFINQHYTLTTTAGARKRDHPQSFDWREPWWDDYKDLNDYNARASFLLSQGTTKQRILVLHPTTTGFLVSKEDENSDLMWGVEPTTPDMRSYLQLLQLLTDGQWDFDLGDEVIMERLASVQDRRLTVGGQSYGLVVMSGDMKNMRGSTMSLLKEFLSSGGTVLSQGPPGPYLDGEMKPEAFQALSTMPNYLALDDWNAVSNRLNQMVGQRIKSSTPWPVGVAHMRRVLDNNQTVFFFVNHSLSEFDSFIEFEGTHLEKWNMWNGEQESVPCLTTEFGVGFNLKLNQNESIMVVVNNESVADKPEESDLRHAISPAAVTLSAENCAIEPEDQNVFVIDYCDLSVDLKTYADINTIEAGHTLFRHRGFDQNPWDNSIQFRRRILDRNTFGENSGFTVTYNFQVISDLPSESLYLVVERAEYYKLQVNGQPVKWNQGFSWLDHNNGAADIRSFVRTGSNSLTLTVERFHVFLEVEPVYLRGSFSVKNANGSWVLDIPQSVSLGPWTEQGYPFYPGAFMYQYALKVPENCASVYASLPASLEATACSLSVNGRRVGLVGIDDGGMVDLTAFLNPGANEVALRVCGGLKNLFGPHHDPERSRRSAWPNMWRKGPKFGNPLAEQYDLIDYGAKNHVQFFVQQ
ncbi:MAG: glycosyl hydrolase [Bacilli bacterium]